MVDEEVVDEDEAGDDVVDEDVTTVDLHDVVGEEALGKNIKDILCFAFAQKRFFDGASIMANLEVGI